MWPISIYKPVIKRIITHNKRLVSVIVRVFVCACVFVRVCMTIRWWPACLTLQLLSHVIDVSF